MRYVKPLDTQLLHSVFKKFDNIITIEDVTFRRIGSAILEFMCDNGYSANVKGLVSGSFY